MVDSPMYTDLAMLNCSRWSRYPNLLSIVMTLRLFFLSSGASFSFCSITLNLKLIVMKRKSYKGIGIIQSK